MCYSLENSESVRGNSFYLVNQNPGFNDAFYLESLLQHLTLHSCSTEKKQTKKEQPNK